MDFFRDFVRGWFESRFPGPTRIQKLGWPVLARGENALLLAPTGSGKTLAGFLWSIDQVSRLDRSEPQGARVLYVSPLKALAYDVERNLRAPLAGIQRWAEKQGTEVRRIAVDLRTGDTPSRERRRQLREPAEILVTTPESLYLLLGSRAAANLTTVHTVIVDEIHSLAPNKRGAHLALSLERLSELANRDPQRIGLSATVRPPDAVSRFLGGDRHVTVVDASEPARIELSVRVPVPDMTQVPMSRPGDEGGPIPAERLAPPPSAEPGSMWSMIYPELLRLVRKHRSTIVFVNSRALAERLAERINELAGEALARAHHGSISHARRQEIEEALKAGRLKGIVATSSLELGIDMGSVDLVVLVESPGSVSRGLQRVGRAGHGVGETSLGVVFPKFRGDLLECAVVTGLMRKGELEPIGVPENPLDVLAQQIVAMCVDGPRSVGELERIVRRAAPYRELSHDALISVLDMLAGNFASAELAELRPRLRWDRARDVLSARRGAKMIAILNGGTIPDRGLYSVHIGEDGPRVGELDEEMVYETRRGETFLLGASSWRVEAITRDRVIVSPAPGEPGKMPFWRGDGPGRPIELGRALGAFVRELGGKDRAEANRWLEETTPLDATARENLIDYVEEQREHTGSLPTDRSITIERFRDELGDWRIAILTPFGARVHAPWALALKRSLSLRSGFEAETMYTDDGIVLRLADADELPGTDWLIPEPEEVEDLVVEELGHSSLFAAAFRENAARALLLPRRRADGRTPLWLQRLRAKNLLASVRGLASFPIVLETYRQCLRDVFDLPALEGILRSVRSRTIHVHEIETASASPFARSLSFAYVANYLYEGDTPLAERKAQALTLDRNLLRELLGQAELRELIDPETLVEVEEELAGRAPDWRARSADELEDLLRRVGDLSEPEISERSAGDPAPWLETLLRERRVAAARIAGEERYLAIADAGRYRDALGAVPPPWIPESLLGEVASPLEDLVRRYARTHGPFYTEDAASRFGLLPAQIEAVLLRLHDAGHLIRGELRPGGARPEWCDASVLRRIKRRTLAKLRKQVAPVEASVLGRFLPEWHGLGEERQGMPRLEEAIAQLEGLPLPWSTLIHVLLPARVRDFRTDMLDRLSASGSHVWVGAGAIGARDGRVILYRRDRAPRLMNPPPAYQPQSPLEAGILDHLRARGASFTMELVRQTGAGLTAIDDALGRLVWAGQITNDTFSPLVARRVRRRSGREPKVAGGRWSLVADLFDERVTETERAHARALMLLERYGVVSREAAAHEEIAFGFKTLYPVLKEMEERGRLRRGYFVEGLSGAQFALAGAVERIRDTRDRMARETVPDVESLAAVDPANPYGSLLAWPETRTERNVRPRRVPGAWVLLHRGELVLFLERGGKSLLTFEPFSEPDVAQAAVEALKRLPGRRPRSIRLEWIDDERPRESRYSSLLKESGFFDDYTSMVYAYEPR